MVERLRKQFNAEFTDEKYQNFLRLLDEACGVPIGFRNCETPCFFPKELLAKMARYGSELIEQLMSNSEYLRAASETIPSAYRVANETEHPLFVQVDFGLTADLEPKLVEIQGFPSLYAYQPYLAETYRQAYGMDSNLQAYLGDLDTTGYRKLFRDAVVGEHDPENVILLEIDPLNQKTLTDFILTEKLCGIKAVCIRDIKKQGNRLFYQRNGKKIPIKRIYNRVIVDELIRRQIKYDFDLRDELEVEWAGHPNWYFKLSKFSLPYLSHPCVPKTEFLDRIEMLPDDLENYVLKPLFSFAGLGVRIGLSVEEINIIENPAEYVLQERVNFAPLIETPHGLTKAEIRIMYIGEAELLPVTSLIRMGRGSMMGVDQNRNLEWVGASAGFSALN